MREPQTRALCSTQQAKSLPGQVWSTLRGSERARSEKLLPCAREDIDRAVFLLGKSTNLQAAATTGIVTMHYRRQEAAGVARPSASCAAELCEQAGMRTRAFVEALLLELLVRAVHLVVIQPEAHQ
jgi:hypothetical protein